MGPSGSKEVTEATRMGAELEPIAGADPSADAVVGVDEDGVGGTGAVGVPGGESAPGAVGRFCELSGGGPFGAVPDDDAAGSGAVADGGDEFALRTWAVGGEDDGAAHVVGIGDFGVELPLSAVPGGHASADAVEFEPCDDGEDGRAVWAVAVPGEEVVAVGVVVEDE